MYVTLNMRVRHVTGQAQCVLGHEFSFHLRVLASRDVCNPALETVMISCITQRSRQIQPRYPDTIPKSDLVCLVLPVYLTQPLVFHLTEIGGPKDHL